MPLGLEVSGCRGSSDSVGEVGQCDHKVGRGGGLAVIWMALGSRDAGMELSVTLISANTILYLP